MNLGKEGFKSTDLWKKVITQTNHATNCGALQSIVTNYEFIEDANIKFLVRILANFSRKEEAKKPQKQQRQKIGKKK